MNQQICSNYTPQAELAGRFPDRICAWQGWDQISCRLAKFHQRLFRKRKTSTYQELHTPPNAMNIEERLEVAKRALWISLGASGIQINRWN